MTLTLARESDILPGFSWQNRELLVGHKALFDPIFMGGAFTSSINSYNLGPMPYTYPSLLGWVINKLFSNLNISQYYISLNIYYFIILFIISLTLFMIYNFFGKFGAYIFIFLMLSSIFINNGNTYFTSIPSHLNPGSLQFYSITLLFLFLLSMIDNKKRYYYLLIFFSGVFLHNYIASAFLALIIFIYSIFYLFKNFKLNNKAYFFLILSLLPWIQVILYKILDFKELLSIINFIRFRNSWYNESNSVGTSTLYNQMPFNSLVNSFLDISKYSDKLSTLFFFMFLFFIISNHFLIKKEIMKSGYINKLFYLNLLTIFFIIDYFINIYVAKEPQQYNHIAGHSYLFFFLILYKFVSNFKSYFKKFFFMFLIILITVTNTSSNAGIFYQDNNILTNYSKSLLLANPLKIVKYDFYNVSEVAYTDFVYELLENNADLCLVKPDLSIYAMEKNLEDNLFSSLHFIDHLYCSKKQLEEKNRLAVYLVEDASLSLPLYLSGMTKISVLINDATRRCVPELHRDLLEFSSSLTGNCITNYIYKPHYNLSIYIDRTYSEFSITNHQNRYIDSLILSGKTMWGNG